MGFNDTEFGDKVYEWAKTQIALKPVKYYAEGDDRIICPNEKCNYPELTFVFKEEEYCTECGQKLDWT